MNVSIFRSLAPQSCDLFLPFGSYALGFLYGTSSIRYAAHTRHLVTSVLLLIPRLLCTMCLWFSNCDSKLVLDLRDHDTAYWLNTFLFPFQNWKSGEKNAVSFKGQWKDSLLQCKTYEHSDGQRTTSFSITVAGCLRVLTSLCKTVSMNKLHGLNHPQFKVFIESFSLFFIYYSFCMVTSCSS